MAASLRFVSRVDGWLMAVLLAAVMASLYAIASIANQGAAQLAWIGLLVGLPGVALPLWLLADTSYVLTDDSLRVRSGPFRWRVPLREIRAVAPSRSLLSGPALSLDRLRIDHGRARSLLISPKDRERFLSELNHRRAKTVPAHS